jgi:hypothetical protein
MKVLLVTFSDGSTWKIEAAKIAENKAAYYAEIDPDTTFDQEFNEVIGDDYALEDWAKGNMDWKDVRPFATLVFQDKKHVNYDHEWSIADMEVTVK